VNEIIKPFSIILTVILKKGFQKGVGLIQIKTVRDNLIQAIVFYLVQIKDSSFLLQGFSVCIYGEIFFFSSAHGLESNTQQGKSKPSFHISLLIPPKKHPHTTESIYPWYINGTTQQTRLTKQARRPSSQEQEGSQCILK
jgi:hypothetical protein